jgi:hypothetical protein
MIALSTLRTLRKQRDVCSSQVWLVPGLIPGVCQVRRGVLSSDAVMQLIRLLNLRRS